MNSQLEAALRSALAEEDEDKCMEVTELLVAVGVSYFSVFN